MPRRRDSPVRGRGGGLWPTLSPAPGYIAARPADRPTLARPRSTRRHVYSEALLTANCKQDDPDRIHEPRCRREEGGADRLLEGGAETGLGGEQDHQDWQDHVLWQVQPQPYHGSKEFTNQDQLMK